MSKQNLKDGDIYFNAIDSLWDTVYFCGEPETFLKQYKSIDEIRRNLFTSHCCYSEVCNGGFHQFFINPTGVLAPEAALGFKAIGLNSCADIVEQAISFFGNSFPREWEKRNSILDKFSEENLENWNPFFNLDNEFYDALDLKEFLFEKMADKYADKFLKK
jgi:hypothetical protein